LTSIAENISEVSLKIRAFEESYRRSAGSVSLLAVSKKHSEDKIRQAAAAGIQNFGENYFQEAEQKIKNLTDLDLSWHFIGSIQANKTRKIAVHFDWVHSIDQERISRRLNDHRPESHPLLNVCVQINLSNEKNKSGAELDHAKNLCSVITSLPNLRLRGLMAIPAPLPDLESQRNCFHRLNRAFEALKKSYTSMDTLSMGMTNDFEAAVAEGSTMVRLGSAIFGPRV